MKITKAQLKQIIVEELQLQQEIYVPFVGGKLPYEEVSLRLKQFRAILDAASALPSQEQAVVIDRLDSNYLQPGEDDLMTAIEAGPLKKDVDYLRTIANERGSKKEHHAIVGQVDQKLDTISKMLGGVAAEFVEKKKKASAAARAREEERTKQHKARQLRQDWEAGENRRRHAKDAKERAGKDNFMSNRLSRARQNKADRESLEEIIRQELAKILKGN